MNMPLVLLNRRRRGGPAAFSPSALFALAEPGVWYDPSDLTTLFTDTAGTTPVTTPGQTVALALDKSRGLVLGSELVTNGDFDTDTAWTKVQATTTISGGYLNLISPNSAGDVATQAISGLTSGVGYRVVFSIVGRSAGSFKFIVRNGANTVTVAETTVSADGNYTLFFVATGTSHFLRLQAVNTNTVLSIDNISVRELPGFHATQATAASRPTYGIVPATGRRNLLTFTEQFDNAAWEKVTAAVTANTAVAPDGTTTADKLITNAATALTAAPAQQILTPAAGAVSFSIYAKSAEFNRVLISNRDNGSAANNASVTVSLVDGSIVSAASAAGTWTNASSTVEALANGWYRITLSYTSTNVSTRFRIYSADASATTGNGTSGILIWGAQLETGSSATAYQRVGSAFDVTEAGVPSLSYLSFDGVDDFMVTPTITPGIDKAQVFAGVRKLSDAATGLIVELSANVGLNNGSNYLASSAIGPASPDYAFASKGTTSRIPVALGFSAPLTNVLTGLGDISGDLATLRVNGVQAAQNTGDQGTGNYLAYPLYIGRRGGTTLPFNGNIFSLIVRFGANLDAGTITSTETWVNGKTGAYA